MLRSRAQEQRKLCSGYLTSKRLEADAGGLDRSYLWNRQAVGSRREAFISPFNGVLANQAACHVLQLILGHAGSHATSAYKMYDGILGTLTPWEVSQRDGCRHCSGIVVNGDPVWS